MMYLQKLVLLAKSIGKDSQMEDPQQIEDNYEIALQIEPVIECADIQFDLFVPTAFSDNPRAVEATDDDFKKWLTESFDLAQILCIPTEMEDSLIMNEVAVNIADLAMDNWDGQEDEERTIIVGIHDQLFKKDENIVKNWWPEI